MSPHQSRVGRSRGFTLLELLIAVAAFAIVLTAINSVFFGALRLRNKASESLDAALPRQHALAILRADLANIIPPGGKFAGALQTSPNASIANQTSQGAGISAASLAVLAAATQPGQTSPEFSTTTGLIDELSPWAEVVRVSYFLAPSTNGTVGRDLFRSVRRNLLPSLVDAPIQEPLLSGVETIYFSYHDGSQWKDTWDSTTEMTPLPRAIKVQLNLASEQTSRFPAPPMELVVPLLVDSTNQTQTASTTSEGGEP